MLTQTLQDNLIFRGFSNGLHSLPPQHCQPFGFGWTTICHGILGVINESKYNLKGHNV